MIAAYIGLAALTSFIVVASGVAKLRRDPHVVKIIHEVARVPMEWLPWLAACEFAGALGLLTGIAWPPLGIAAAIGLVLYFVGAVVAHLRVGDAKGLGAPGFVLGLAVACLVTRVLT
jgi:DoxX-like family